MRSTDVGATAALEPDPARAPTLILGIGVDQLLVVVAVMLAVLLEIIDTSIVNVALPSIMGNLGATLDEAQWIIIGYIVSNVIIIPMTGWLAARFGRKRYFVASILIFTSASLFCGLSQSIGSLVFWRIVQGLGGGALLSTAQTILVETFPVSQQGTGQAIFGVGAMIGPSLGPTLGGWLTDHYSWHWIFWINVPLGLAAASMCAARLRDPAHAGARRTPVDWIGIVLLVVGVGALQLMLERGHRQDWFESREIVGWAAAAAGGIGLFIWQELRCSHPIVDLRVLRRRSLALGCILGSVVGVGLYGSIFLFPLYAQSLLGWNAWDSGLAILPSSLATAAAMMFVGRLVWTFGPRPIFVFGISTTALALAWMTTWTLESGFHQVLGPQILRGIALGALFVPLSTATLRALPPAELAQGSGLYNLTRQLAGSIGIAILTTMLDERTVTHRVGLANHASRFDPMVAQFLDRVSAGMAAQGADPGTVDRTAAAILGKTMNAHAAMGAFQDLYLGLALLFACALPLAFLMARHAPGKVSAQAH